MLTVFSPCVLPVLPIILMSGVESNAKRINGLISGIVVSLVIVTLFLSLIISLFGVSAEDIRTVSVFILIFLGLGFIFPKIGEKVTFFIEKKWFFKPIQNKSSGFVGGFVTGVSLGLVWTPCVGPVIATVATLSAINLTVIMSIITISVYSFGVAIPLYLIATGSAFFSKRLSFIKTNGEVVRQVFGLIILLTALFIWTGADKYFQSILNI